jgi:hypothetical protein
MSETGMFRHGFRNRRSNKDRGQAHDIFQKKGLRILWRFPKLELLPELRKEAT